MKVDLSKDTIYLLTNQSLCFFQQHYAFYSCKVLILSTGIILIFFFFVPLVILGTETSNKYEIKNSLGQRIYFAVEESICFNRTFCSTLRSCTLKITDNSGQEVMTVNRPLRCNSCWCPCYLQEVSHCSYKRLAHKCAFIFTTFGKVSYYFFSFLFFFFFSFSATLCHMEVPRPGNES